VEVYIVLKRGRPFPAWYNDEKDNEVNIIRASPTFYRARQQAHEILCGWLKEYGSSWSVIKFYPSPDWNKAYWQAQVLVPGTPDARLLYTFKIVFESIGELKPESAKRNAKKATDEDDEDDHTDEAEDPDEDDPGDPDGPGFAKAIFDECNPDHPNDTIHAHDVR